MKEIRVKTSSPYSILIQGGGLIDVPQDLKSLNLGYKYALITDNNVAEVLGKDFLRILQQEGLKGDLFVFPAGEASKNIDTVIDLARKMLALGYDRKSAIVALGGGVVGDIAGFLASIFLRGIPYVQIPTTLLAQVDSSIGGKTGVDLPEGKNLLGTFYQPQKVYIDYGVLSSLPWEHFKNGLAEVVKYGCIWKDDFFRYLEEHVEDILSYEPEALEYIIFESCSIKAAIVSQDEREGNLRRILNFGHTIGHAIEAASNYKLLHGFCVSMGMMAAVKISEELDLVSSLSSRLEALLKALDLPYRIPKEVSGDEILKFMRSDKKVWKGKLSFILLRSLGEAQIYEEPPLEVIKKVIFSLQK